MVEGRSILSRALDDDLRKVTEHRATIDAELGSQLEQLDSRPQRAGRALSE